MEHWLPFYYETLETLFDYLPGAAVSFDYQAGEARAHRFESIADFYAAEPVKSIVKVDPVKIDSAAWTARIGTLGEV